MAGWEPVLDALSSERDVIAVDLPGHGASPMGPPEVPHTIGWFADQLVDFIDSLGLATVHVAGVSFGGWIALEFAKSGRARSVTALCPGGQWVGSMPLFPRISLRLTRLLTRVAQPFLAALLRPRIARTVLLYQMVGRPWQVPPDEAADFALAFASCPGYAQAYRGVKSQGFTGGEQIDVPVTIAYGERDRLMLRGQAQRRELAPPGAQLLTLKGCGHVPLWDDPDEVARMILHRSKSAA